VLCHGSIQAEDLKYNPFYTEFNAFHTPGLCNMIFTFVGTAFFHNYTKSTTGRYTQIWVFIAILNLNLPASFNRPIHWSINIHSNNQNLYKIWTVTYNLLLARSSTFLALTISKTRFIPPSYLYPHSLSLYKEKYNWYKIQSFMNQFWFLIRNLSTSPRKSLQSLSFLN